MVTIFAGAITLENSIYSAKFCRGEVFFTLL